MFRAIPVTLWICALALVTVIGAFNWYEWRMDVEELRANLEPRADDDFPGAREDVQERLAQARVGLRSTNREHGIDLGICGAIGAALIGGAVVYVRRVPRAERPSWRSWLFVLPFVAGLVVLGVIWFGYAMRGAITG